MVRACVDDTLKPVRLPLVKLMICIKKASKTDRLFYPRIQVCKTTASLHCCAEGVKEDSTSSKAPSHQSSYRSITIVCLKLLSVQLKGSYRARNLGTARIISPKIKVSMTNCIAAVAIFGSDAVND